MPIGGSRSRGGDQLGASRRCLRPDALLRPWRSGDEPRERRRGNLENDLGEVLLGQPTRARVQ